MWDRGEADDKVRYVDVDHDEDDEEEGNDWTGGSIFTKLSLLAPSTTIYLHLIPRHSSVKLLEHCNNAIEYNIVLGMPLWGVMAQLYYRDRA